MENQSADLQAAAQITVLAVDPSSISALEELARLKSVQAKLGKDLILGDVFPAENEDEMLCFNFTAPPEESKWPLPVPIATPPEKMLVKGALLILICISWDREEVKLACRVLQMARNLAMRIVTVQGLSLCSMPSERRKLKRLLRHMGSLSDSVCPVRFKRSERTKTRQRPDPPETATLLRKLSILLQLAHCLQDAEECQGHPAPAAPRKILLSGYFDGVIHGEEGLHAALKAALQETYLIHLLPHTVQGCSLSVHSAVAPGREGSVREALLTTLKALLPAALSMKVHVTRDTALTEGQLRLNLMLCAVPANLLPRCLRFC